MKTPRLLAFVLYFAISFNCFAAQNAVVKTEKAYVYSDLDMTTTIGYILQGRQIRVGSISRNQNSVLPIVVSGKIGYIKISDILLESDNLHLKNNPQLNQPATNSPLQSSESTFKNIGFMMSFFSPGADFSLMSEKVNGSTAGNLARTYRFYTTFIWDKYLFRAGVDQFSFNEKVLKFSPLAPSLDYLYHITDFFHEHHLFASIGMVFPLSLNTATIWGVRIAPEWVYELPHHFQVMGAIEYHYYRASGTDKIYFSSDSFTVNNLGMNLALQYRF